MAIDRAMLARSDDDGALPTLRIYQWERPTLSLGRFQEAGSIDMAVCSSRGVDVVRRPTGGRGVLHDDEVTYAVVAGTRDGVPRGTAASYRHLGEALAAAYRGLGLAVGVVPRSSGRGHSGHCYLHATQADLALGEAKVSGGAQVWSHDHVLQHGSLVISRDTVMEAELFGLDDGEVAALRSTATTIGDVLAVAPSREAVAAALVEAFESMLGVEFRRGDLTREERACADPWIEGHVVARTGDADYAR
jgi:lipoate-protein ligase A